MKGDNKINYYNVNCKNLDEVNDFRKEDGKKPLNTLNGYCMSSGCSCIPDKKCLCGLFKEYEQDGIKKDFIYQILGI